MAAAVAQPGEGVETLSARERQVLSLVASGMSNTAIRRELWISDKTLESHLTRIYWKLGISRTGLEHRRVQAVLAWRSGVRQVLP